MLMRRNRGDKRAVDWELDEEDLRLAEEQGGAVVRRPGQRRRLERRGGGAEAENAQKAEGATAAELEDELFGRGDLEDDVPPPGGGENA